MLTALLTVALVVVFAGMVALEVACRREARS